MGSTLGLYFDLSQERANALRDRLNQVAGKLGYTARAGATYGQGNLAALLQGIDAGDCEVRRVRWLALTAADLFDSVIGWGSIYPPSNDDVATALAAVPERYRAIIGAQYDREGIGLHGVRPAQGLSYGGTADRWTVELDDDWQAPFMRGIRTELDDTPLLERRALTEEDEFSEAAWNFALDIATAVDQELVARLGDDPHYGEGTRWGFDEERNGYWYQAR